MPRKTITVALNAKDRHHQLAVQLLRASRGDAIVPDPVVVEVEMTLRRSGPRRT